MMRHRLLCLGIATTAMMTASCTTTTSYAETTPVQDVASDLAMVVASGVDWAVRHQGDNGSYADDFGQANIEATSLMALALLGEGNTVQTGPRANQLAAAISWLRQKQRVDGTFADGANSAARSARLQGLATYAMMEAAGLSGMPTQLAESAELAVAATSSLRNDDGGWPKHAGGNSDIVTTGWCAVALQSARFFGLEVAFEPNTVLAWFDENATSTAAEAGSALFTMYYLGADPEKQPRMRELAAFVLQHARTEDPEETYWATYALYQRGGDDWRQWQPRMQQELLGTQEAAGENRGSWAPAGATSRATTTALRTLALEAYYRFSRLVR
ncbi:MAG: prenyltransferase/squalene oxidase repeat-containing protein [Planctomycetota bacterium]